MIGVDTNILVRFLTQDDAAQAVRVDRLFEKALASNERIHIDDVVLCELAWVLGAAYGRTRAEITDALEELTAASQVSLSDRGRVREAVARYRAGPGGLADYLIGLRNRAEGCTATATFDRALVKDELFAAP